MHPYNTGTRLKEMFTIFPVTIAYLAAYRT